MFEEKSGKEGRKPTVIIEYPGPSDKGDCQDVFVYLRPETNGVKVESTLLRVVRSNPEYREHMKLIYLANIPGEFIVKHRIIEHYYASKLYFTSGGKRTFTPYMRKTFEEHFGVSYEEADIIGAFEALKRFSMNYNDLFQLRVPASDLLTVHEQSIKKHRNVYIINYDIPALLHKNNNKTDIAVMIFRTCLNYALVHNVIDEMGRALIKDGILDPRKPLSRMFHYSKGPFGQIRDAIGYLYRTGDQHVPLEEINFCSYLRKQEITLRQIVGCVRNPIGEFANNGHHEESIFEYTKDNAFNEAYEKLTALESQVVLDPHCTVYG
jgi:hypothetical protein